MTVGGNSLGPRRLLSTALLLAVAAMFLVTLVAATGSSRLAPDFRWGYLDAAHSVRAGESPYAGDDDQFDYLYPPVLAEALVPLTVLPDDVSSFFAFAASVAAVMGALAVVGVRDVRCYAAVVIWAPAWNTFEIANVTGLLTLLSAVVWRYRDARWRSAAALGAALCLKLFLWPLAVWAAATRRLRIAGAALAIGVGLALVSWAVIDFTGFTSYPDVLRGQPFEDSYSLVGIAAALGLDQGVGRVATAVVGGSLLAATVHLGRRQEEQRAFLCAIFASLALSPVLWLHYFAVLSRAVGDCSSALLRPLAAADSPLDVPTFRERRWCAALRSGDSRLRVHRRARALAECRPSGVGSAGVTTEARPIAGRPWPPRTLTLSRITWLASIVFFGALPALVLALLAIDVHGETIAIDLHQFYDAAQAILDGRSPYPPNGEPTTPLGGPYPYPPLPALLLTPLSLLPLEVAGAVLMALLVCAALAVPFVLGVRDWRCYGLALLWPPVISAIQTGNLTLWLALACAVAWRFRDRRVLSSASIGITLAAKFFLWPLVVWFAATRRSASAVLACVRRCGRAPPLMGGDRFRRIRRLPSSPAATRRTGRRRLVHDVHRRTRSRSPVPRLPWLVARSRACARGLCRRSRPETATSGRRSSSPSLRRSPSRRSCGSITSRFCSSSSRSRSLGWGRCGSCRWRCSSRREAATRPRSIRPGRSGW